MRQINYSQRVHYYQRYLQGERCADLAKEAGVSKQAMTGILKRQMPNDEKKMRAWGKV